LIPRSIFLLLGSLGLFFPLLGFLSPVLSPPHRIIFLCFRAFSHHGITSRASPPHSPPFSKHSGTPPACSFSHRSSTPYKLFSLALFSVFDFYLFPFSPVFPVSFRGRTFLFHYWCPSHLFRFIFSSRCFFPPHPPPLLPPPSSPSFDVFPSFPFGCISSCTLTFFFTFLFLKPPFKTPKGLVAVYLPTTLFVFI